MAFSLTSFILGALLFGAASIIFAWTGPTQTAPNGNVSAPVNVGTTDQVKSAGLSVNSLAVFGNAILSGASRYLNFGTIAGSSGYGTRDNAGVMEYKHNGGAWTRISNLPNCVASGATLVWNGSAWTCSEPPPPPPPPPPPASITHTANNAQTGWTTTYTFSSVALGSADPARKIILGVCGGVSVAPPFSTVTIAGITATKVQDSLNSNARCGFFVADVPNGTSGNIVVNWTASIADTSIVVYRAIGLSSNNPYAVSNDNTVNGSNDMSASLDIPTGGVGIGLALWDGASGTITSAWTNLTEDADRAHGNNNTTTSASYTTAGTLTRTVHATGTLGPGGASSLALFASWSP